MKRLGGVTWLVIGAALALGLGGCSDHPVDLTGLVQPGPSSGPTPNSPTAALRLFEWSYNNRDTVGCRDLFTADYHFLFNPLDSAGAPYRSTPWTRNDELISTAHFFVFGNEGVPPAASIRLTLDRNFFVAPDPNFAWDPEGRWHKNIRTQVVLNAQTGDGNAIDISGAANFFLVRSDSAVVPLDFASHAAVPDTTRWWIRRWIDETAQSGGVAGRAGSPMRTLATQPSSNRTWGGLKVMYR
jgi:hypothetical protein